MKFLKKYFAILILSIFIMPQFAFAYSSYVIPGGDAVGVSLNSNGVMIVGFYEVNGKNPGNDSKLKVGDVITSIDGVEISSISDMVNIISRSDGDINIEYLRNNKTNNTSLKLETGEDGVYKTGLYVKDSITGLGTLTYVDPQSKIYGILGHEITEKSSGLKLEVKDGKIFEASITNIIKTQSGIPGEKNAKFYSSNVFGTVLENTNKGVFGKYTDTLPDKEPLKVAQPNEIKVGDAKILTSLSENNIEEFSIKILKINSNSKTKNILFEITDERLINETGGIVQGMSGSPIIQDNMIVGAVTHVVVDNPKKGYGIFITTMLEEGEN